MLIWFIETLAMQKVSISHKNYPRLTKLHYFHTYSCIHFYNFDLYCTMNVVEFTFMNFLWLRNSSPISCIERKHPFFWFCPNNSSRTIFNKKYTEKHIFLTYLMNETSKIYLSGKIWYHHFSNTSSTMLIDRKVCSWILHALVWQ